MFNSFVVPVNEYRSGIWVFKQFNTTDTLQNEAKQYFLGVHRFTPIHVKMEKRVGRVWVNIIKLWNRLISMDDNRLTKMFINC